MAEFWFWECEACGFRYPAEIDDVRAPICALCGATSRPRSPHHSAQPSQPQPQPRPQLSALLDNIRSIHNVGSMFRTADGAGVVKLYLGGITATPEHPKLAKAALGAHERVAWQHDRNGVTSAEMLKASGHALWALEGSDEAEWLISAEMPPPTTPLTLVVGNERAGVDPAILDLCDRHVALPMHGSKRSLNVAVAFGIAIYTLTFQHAR